MTNAAAAADSIASLAALSDEEMLTRVVARDPAAWRELLRRYRNHLFGCIQRIAYRYQLSSDDVNEIYGDLWLNLLVDDLHRLRVFDRTRGAKLSTWLGLLAVHTTYDHLRRNRRKPVACDAELALKDIPVTDPDALDLLIEKDQLDRVLPRLRNLAKRERCFIELYYRRGLEPEQVARRMRISVKTVYAKKSKIAPKLRAIGERVAREAR